MQLVQPECFLGSGSGYITLGDCMKEIGYINRNELTTLKTLEDKIQELKMEYNITCTNMLVDVVSDNIVFYKRDKYDIIKE